MIEKSDIVASTPQQKLPEAEKQWAKDQEMWAAIKHKKRIVGWLYTTFIITIIIFGIVGTIALILKGRV